ncbi:hypothetical protein M378DRAFT_167241 [Amanita muscaria Koide BX008]|uniref:Uncharacterized protein n=1 Tax=Amanita muscaria (strain Koide BX008) TaxID=946122 RepID=A0A0C2SDV9_AMAMK|nr:hypothetical protein M378DRAFT_167241 [Amanita muscaria Koide BX008]
MNKHIKFNILGLGNVARYMSNEDGLKAEGITDERLEEKIPQQLRYACVYWANHFKVINIEETNLMKGLAKFVDDHMLHWFEALSLIGNLDSAHYAVRVVLKLLKSTPSDLHQLLSDALRFISKFYTVINRSALHTYYSALPFAPTCSLLYRQYIKEARHNIGGIEGGPEKWDALVANLSHAGTVYAIKFSPDSTLLVSCSDEHVFASVRHPGKLKIWDAATGTPISMISGRRFAFTDDFSTIASSEDNIITYCNMDGSTRGTMITTSSMIEELALSQSSRVAAALSDGTVWLWESRNVELICSFDGFESTGWPWLQFSPSGTRLTYPSANGIVKMWDGITGRFVADLLCGSCPRFVFSDDGSRIASLSRDCGLSLWSTESGGLVGAIRSLDHSVLAISANGSLIATANPDCDYATLWSKNCNTLAEISVLESRYTESMAFSLDNILAIGTFSGIKLYNTNTHTFISTLSCSAPPTSLAFSPDCTHLAGGKDYDNVYLWDMRDIHPSSPPFKEASDVTAMALSRDCSRLVCAFRDRTVEQWETSPTMRRIASRQRHLVVSLVEFGPDSRLFASGSIDGTIELWDGGDGSFRGTLKASGGLQAVALSGSVLVAAGSRNVTLWSLDTLSLIHTFTESGHAASISDESDLAAIAVGVNSVFLFDVVNCTTIATFSLSFTICKLSFLPDKSRLVARDHKGDFLSLDLVNNSTTNGLALEHLIQLPDTPLWHGVPVWHRCANSEDYYSALFSQHQTPVPVLWIPRDFLVYRWIEGSSIIALGCADGRIILLRLPTSLAHDS